MIYKGYSIIVELNVNSQWDFELDEGKFIYLTNHIDDGEADIDNIADFLVIDPDGENMDWRDTVDECKALIDSQIKSAGTPESEG